MSLPCIETPSRTCNSEHFVLQKSISLESENMTHQQEKTWKHFNENPLTHSAGHYLLTIHDLRKELGYARMTDIGKRLSVKPSTCCAALRSLKNKGFVTEDPNKFLLLTEDGKYWVEILIRNEQMLERFLIQCLGVDPKQAEIDACKIEHLISAETSMHLCRFVKFMESHPQQTQKFIEEIQSQSPYEEGSVQCENCPHKDKCQAMFATPKDCCGNCGTDPSQ